MTAKVSPTGSREIGPTSKANRGPALLEIAGYGSFRIDKAATIGRAPGNEVLLNAPSVSRRHARILFEAGEYWIEDLGSANGSTVNGKTVQKQVLNDQARITLGEVEAVFRIGREVTEPAGRLSGPQRRFDSGVVQRKSSGRFKAVSGMRPVEEAARQPGQSAGESPETRPSGEAGGLAAELQSLRGENEKLRRTVKQLERQLADTNLRLRNLQATLEKEQKH